MKLLTQSLLFGAGKVGPPLDIKLGALNCTAFSIQWKMPMHPGSPIIGYTVSTRAWDHYSVCVGVTVHPSYSSLSYMGCISLIQNA
jgi:hypothetical protein